MVDARLDLHDARDEIRLRLDLDRARARDIDVVDRGDAARPRRHHDDAVGQEDRLRDRVGDEGDGLAGLHPDFLDQHVHLVAREGVERAERLVHQEHRRIDGEAAHDRGALLHAAGKLARIFVVEAGEADALQELLDARRGPARVRFSSKGSWMFFSSVRHGSRLASWKIIAICGCGRVIGSPSRRDLARPSARAGRPSTRAAWSCRSRTGR